MKLFRRDKRKQYLVFPEEPPLPPCPFKCQWITLRGVYMAGGQRDLELTSSTEPCEHQLAAVQHAAFDQAFEQVYDPIHDDWVTKPRS